MVNLMVYHDWWLMTLGYLCFAFINLWLTNLWWHRWPLHTLVSLLLGIRKLVRDVAKARALSKRSTQQITKLPNHTTDPTGSPLKSLFAWGKSLQLLLVLVLCPWFWVDSFPTKGGRPCARNPKVIIHSNDGWVLANNGWSKSWHVLIVLLISRLIKHI